MLQTRTQRLFSVLAALTMVSCHDASPTPLAPPAPVTPVDRVPFSVDALTPFQIGRPGRRAAADPYVVVRDRTALPVAGVTVKFVADSGGSIAVTSAITDIRGTASCGAWTLAATGRENRVVATVDGVGSVTFRAEGRPVALPVERYDLLTVSGQSLPITYSGGGRSWSTIEGHYELARDGTFDFWQVWVYSDDASRRRDSVLVTGTYARHSVSLVAIYFPQNLTGTGTFAGDRLSIEYSDFLNWEPEVYVRAR